jgi:SEP domain/UBX domain
LIATFDSAVPCCHREASKSSSCGRKSLEDVGDFNDSSDSFVLLPMATSIVKKTIPKRLEDELNSISIFKPTNGPSRRTVADVLDDSVERAAYDEIFGPVINRRPLQLSTLSSKSASSNSTSVVRTETDFTSSLITRLADAEEETKSLRKQMLEKNARINTVESENAQLRAVADAPAHLINEVERYKSINYLLEKQISDMENFLHDYGLQWVGNKMSDAIEVGGQPHLNGMDDDFSRRIDYSSLVPKIEALNSLLCSEPSQVKIDSRRGKIVHAGELFESIDVAVYSDGIMIKRGPFRDCNSDSCNSFIRDIMDGFFPSEFRTEYPDGVMFRLIDRHSIAYIGSADQTAGKLTKEQLLRNVPKTVIKNGTVTPMGEDIAQLFEKASCTDSSCEGQVHVHVQGKGRARAGHIALNTDASATLRIDRDKDRDRDRGRVTGGDGDGGGDDALKAVTGAEDAEKEDDRATASVQVRWLDGTMLLIVLFESDCVGDIRKEILKHTLSASASATASARGSTQLEVEYELRSTYPPRVLHDSMTLKSAGLVPNGTIHARAIQH